MGTLLEGAPRHGFKPQCLPAKEGMGPGGRRAAGFGRRSQRAARRDRRGESRKTQPEAAKRRGDRGS